MDRLSTCWAFSLVRLGVLAKVHMIFTLKGARPLHEMVANSERSRFWQLFVRSEILSLRFVIDIAWWSTLYMVIVGAFPIIVTIFQILWITFSQILYNVFRYILYKNLLYLVVHIACSIKGIKTFPDHQLFFKACYHRNKVMIYCANIIRFHQNQVKGLLPPNNEKIPFSKV